MLLIFSKVPAFLNVVDIAGLVEGANEGQASVNLFRYFSVLHFYAQLKNNYQLH